MLCDAKRVSHNGQSNQRGDLACDLGLSVWFSNSVAGAK